MSKSKLNRLLFRAFSFARMLMMAWMIGIANSINQEGKFMDDTHIKTELVEEQEDDEPFDAIIELKD